MGAENGLFAGDRFIRVVGVRNVFKSFAETRKAADGARAEVVGLDEIGLTSDLELVFEFGVFDPAADVSQGENHLVALEGDGFFLGGWGEVFDGEFRGAGGGDAGGRQQTFL